MANSAPCMPRRTGVTCDGVPPVRQASSPKSPIRALKLSGESFRSFVSLGDGGFVSDKMASTRSLTKHCERVEFHGNGVGTDGACDYKLI